MAYKQKKTKTSKLLILSVGIVAIAFGVFVLDKNKLQKTEDVAAVRSAGPIIVQPNCNANTYQGVRVSFISGVATKTTVAGVNNDRANFQVRYSIRTGACAIYVAIRPVSTFQWWSGSGSSATDFGIYGYPDNPVLQQNIYPNNYYKIAANTQENFTSTFNSDLATASSFNHGSGNYRLYLSQVQWDTINAPTPARTFFTGFTPTSTSTPWTTNWVNLN